jgi:meiotic recombination protein SPO11
MHAKLNRLYIHLAARYLRVLEIVYNALVQDVTITKRHIYYQDVELFGSQQAVDEV